MESSDKNKERWHQTWWGMLLLVIFWPISLIWVIYKNTSVQPIVKVVLIFGVFVLAFFLGLRLLLGVEERRVQMEPTSRFSVTTEHASTTTAMQPTTTTTKKKLTSAELEYAQAMQKNAEGWEEAFEGLEEGEQYRSYKGTKEHGELLIGVSLIYMEELCAQAYDIEEPQRFDALHSNYMRAITDIDSVLETLRIAYAAEDRYLIIQCQDKLETANLLRSQSAKTLKEFTE